MRYVKRGPTDSQQNINSGVHQSRIKYKPVHTAIHIMESPRRNELVEKAKMICYTFGLIFGAFTAAVLAGYWFFSLDNPVGQIYFQSLYIDVTFNTSRFLELRKGPGHYDSLLLKGDIGLSIPKPTPFNVMTKNKTFVHVDWDPYGELKVYSSQSADRSSSCFDLYWKGRGALLWNSLEDCIALEPSVLWYGTLMSADLATGSQIQQNEWQRQLLPGKWHDFDSLDSTGGDMTIERYWLASNGVAIHVSKNTPFQARIIHHKAITKLCFRASYGNKTKYSAHGIYPSLHLDYSLCKSSSIRQVHEHMVNRYGLHPSKGVTQSPFIQAPVWYPILSGAKIITAESLHQYAQEILDSGFDNSVLVIDIEKIGGITSRLRQATDNKLLTNALSIPSHLSKALEEMRKMGFCIAIKIPFTGFLQNIISRIVSYKSKSCNLNCINLHDEKVVKIFHQTMIDCIDNFRKKYDISSFLLELEDSNLSHSSISIPHMQRHARFLLNYLSDCCQNTMVSLTLGTQNTSTFIRIKDINANWSQKDGLASVIASALKLSVMGYPYIIPPGFRQPVSTRHKNSSEDTQTHLKPDMELYVRWFQLTVLFPAVTFTYPPWLYQESNLSSIIADVLAVRKDLMPTLLQLVTEAELGKPIIRPLWWLEPSKYSIISIQDEFLLGDDILVAPVVTPGARHRDIYFPPGSWRDRRLSMTLRGGQWYRQYDAPLSHLPLFFRVEDQYMN